MNQLKDVWPRRTVAHYQESIQHGGRFIITSQSHLNNSNVQLKMNLSLIGWNVDILSLAQLDFILIIQIFILWYRIRNEMIKIPRFSYLFRTCTWYFLKMKQLQLCFWCRPGKYKYFSRITYVVSLQFKKYRTYFPITYI